MKYRINSYNEEYIMLENSNILMEISRLQLTEETRAKQQKEMEKLLRNTWFKINTFTTKSGRKPIINEIAINKNCKLAILILNNAAEYKTSTITIEQIIHALLISIEEQLWEYYNILSNLIMYYKKNNIDNINYESFQNEHGEEITKYISSNSLRISNINNYNNNKNVYLYENGKITQTELPEPTLSTVKTKKRTIN